MKKLGQFHKIIDLFTIKIDPDAIFHEVEQEFLLKPFKLKKISIKKMVLNYVQMSKKYQSGAIQYWKEQWHKNQRKLFIEFLICFCKFNAASPQNLTELDWLYLSNIFFDKNPMFLKFQGLSIMKNLNKLTWNESDDDLIRTNIGIHGEGNWNQVSKSVFFNTNCTKYFSPKQVRERWYNHLSQNINRGEWTIEQDLIILKHVLNKNKHWCEIVKLFQHARTQHMIKNRYKFLVKDSCLNRSAKELRMVNMAISKLKRKLEHRNISDKLIMNDMVDDVLQLRNSVNKTICVEGEHDKPAVNYLQISQSSNENRELLQQPNATVPNKLKANQPNCQITENYCYSNPMIGLMMSFSPQCSSTASYRLDSSTCFSSDTTQLMNSSSLVALNLTPVGEQTLSTMPSFWQPSFTFYNNKWQTSFLPMNLGTF